jgi:hypothetical protein
MFDEKKIAEVIKSREDLIASGIDGISNEIMKGGTNPYRLIKNGQSNARFPIIL